MIAHLYSSASDFGAATGALYRENPVLFTTELTTLRTTPWPENRIMLSVCMNDMVMGAAVQMHGSVLLVSGLPPQTAMTAVRAIVPVAPQLPAVRGTPATATAFTHAWHEVTGVQATVLFEDVLYRLGELAPPSGVSGQWRLAEVGDTEFLVDWLDAFYVEAFGVESDAESSRRVLASVSDAGGHVLIWTVAGVPVSMARLHAAAVGMSRIGPVYTPPTHRGHGYGAAVSSAASALARELGARDVVLFADSGNPVSNRVYRRIGFHPVADSVQYALGSVQPG